MHLINRAHSSLISGAALAPLLVCLLAMAGSASAQSNAVEPDYEFFKNEVQPIFLAKREGNVPCIDCHYRNGTFPMQPLDEGAYFWTEEQSQMNFEAAKVWIQPGQPPLNSRLLRHPLAASAGGDPFHGGGKHFDSQSDPEWRIMADWVAGMKSRRAPRAVVERVIQTNAAGDTSHIIDPHTNKIVGEIAEIEIPHGVAGSPDGSNVYITNEHLRTLDVVDSRTLRVKRRIPVSGRPNNVATSKDGSKVYVGIMQAPGGVDVIDVARMENIKTVATQAEIHNVYVTPDGRYAVAGSVHRSTINVIDTSTDEIAWIKEMSSGVRPMIFSTNEDGSTKDIIVQLSGFHGFAVVDFDSREEVARVEHPAIEDEEAHLDGLQGAPAHGLGIPPDGKTLWSTSKVYSHVYIHSLPDLKEIGRVFVGQHPEWVTFTGDGRYAYIGAAGDNATYVVDTQAMTVIAKVDVGQTPKRVGTVMMQID
jgi:YVTN family beta-propeller protein